jgi:hypothetical protein
VAADTSHAQWPTQLAKRGRADKRSEVPAGKPGRAFGGTRLGVNPKRLTAASTVGLRTAFTGSNRCGRGDLRELEGSAEVYG